MNTYSGAKITQQMYTRERRGIFRSTEGFDTVAKSEGLDSNFVKKILHPFCLYDAPAELAMRGEKNESAFPAALHLLHTENGETVIGSSRYQAADFTGQRSAFFAHNFVVPASRSEEIVQSYGDWLHADFAESYTGELGGTLPELSAIPGAERVRASNPLSVLSSLGIDGGLFKSLLQAVMTSVAGKKKIYVALDVPIEELSARAAELTEVLYGALPYEFRRRLGVITYANEPQSRKYIHLTFVEKGSLRPGDRSVEKDFTFDLASGRTGNADFGESRQPYAELAWKVTQSGGSMDDFGRFADNMLAGESAERRISLALYNELAIFYEIEQGNESLYAENKSAVLGGLLSYLRTDGALESRVRLNDIFLERFDREFDLIRQKGILVPAIMESFKEYFALRGHNYKVRIVEYFINGMLNSASEGREDVLNEAYGIIESDNELSAAFFKRVLAQPVFRKQLLEPYMETRLAAATSAAGITDFVLHWGRVLPEALQQSFIQDKTRDYLLEKLQREADPVAAVAEIHESVEKAEKERRRGAGVQPEALVLLQELAEAADRFLLSRLSLAEMTQEQLLEISFLRYPKGAASWNPPLDLISRQKENALRAAYRWFGEEKPNEQIFSDLSPKELDDVQLLGRRWLKEARSLESFERLPLAFYHSSSRDGGPLDYDELLEMVRRKAGADKETMYRFLAWSQGNPLFAVSNKKFHPGYRRAILKYFLSSDREAFKSREFRKSYAAAAGPALQNVYNEARSQLASPLARWVSRSRFQILISGSIIGIALIIAIIAISMLRPDDKGTALPEASPKPTPTQTAGGELPPAAVYLQDSGNSSRLRFTFSNAEECLRFNPVEISVITAEDTKNTFKVAAMTRTCTVPSAKTDTASDQDGTSGNAGGADGAAGTADSTAGTTTNEETASRTIINAGSTSPSPSPSAPVGDAAGKGATTDAAGTTAYEVIVDLEAGATVVQGSMIEAGDYKLILLADPGSTSSADPSAGSSATVSPEAKNQ